MVFVESSPSNAASLLLLTCLLMSTRLRLYTHHSKATSFNSPAGLKAPAQPQYTHTGVVTYFDWWDLSSALCEHVSAMFDFSLLHLLWWYKVNSHQQGKEV